MNGISRRRLLAATGSAFASITLQGCADGDDPPSVDSTDVTLDISYLQLNLAGRSVNLRVYGGSLPGPTIYTHPGDLLRIRVRNFLPPYDSSLFEQDMHSLGHSLAMNVPHDLNSTNLHVHGMSVIPHLFEPLGTSDPAAPMISIGPGEEKTYDFAVPNDHPSGLYWYHPHLHGSTAVQVASGMSGLIVIKGPIDEVPAIKAAQDILLAVHDLGLFADDPSNPTTTSWSYSPAQNTFWNTGTGSSSLTSPEGMSEGPANSGFSNSDYPLRLYLLNGQPFYEELHNYEEGKFQYPVGTQLPAPRFVLRPGEVVRFRLLNGTTDNLMPLVVDEHTMYLLAIDGVNFLETAAIAYTEGAKVLGQEQVLLPPAGRAEFMIEASSKPGVYAIRALAHEPGAQFFASSEKVIAEIEVAGEPLTMALPTKLPTPTRYYPLTTGVEPAARRDVQFSMFFGDATSKPKNFVVGGDFMINGELYDETSVTFRPKLNTVEEWTLHVDHDPTSSPEGHPFHLHDNSFEVVSIGGKPVDPVVIQDTVWVPHDQKVVIRVRFLEYTGKSVFHCHILPHEDGGMMQNILMVK
ncbi:MAG: multicopper oxidase domain-containing protein [Polyangiaceae bacterium]